jgi:hypothetical protein
VAELLLLGLLHCYRQQQQQQQQQGLKMGSAAG